MKHVSILIPEGSTAMGMFGAMDVLNKANEINASLTGESPEKIYQPIFVSQSDKLVKANFGYPIVCDKTIDEIEETDLVIIPSLEGDLPQRLKQHRPFQDWIVRQYEKGADLASNCTGSFLLASTGLLNGRKATTHWAAAEEFRVLFPNITLLDERVIIDEGRIVSSGGATTFLNLLVYLIEKYHGHELAVVVSKYLLIDMHKVPQTNYAIFSTQRHHRDKAILKIQNHIEGQYAKIISIEELADHIAMSKRTFLRRFKHATGNTPNEYLQRVRVEAAKKMLETADENIEQIGSEVGYADIGSFRKIFKRHTGISLKDYRRKYREMAQSA